MAYPFVWSAGGQATEMNDPLKRRALSSLSVQNRFSNQLIGNQRAHPHR